MPRLFAALAVPPAQTTGALSPAGFWKSASDLGWKLTHPADLHITLQFFGELDEKTATTLRDQLKMVEGKRFSLALCGVGSFRNDSAWYLWARVELVPALIVLRERIQRIAASCGLSGEDRPYCPHVTLGRREIPTGLQSLAAEDTAWVDACKRAGQNWTAEIEISSFQLYACTGTLGQRYQQQTTYPLSQQPEL